MGMRVMALALMLTLAVPAAMTVVCELVCARSAHHSDHTAAATCHAQHGHAAGPVLAEAALACHETSAWPAAAITTAPQQAPAPAPAIDIAPMPLVFDAARVHAHVITSPPDRGPARTQLRI
jgi:hypothetical protein